MGDDAGPESDEGGAPEKGSADEVLRVSCLESRGEDARGLSSVSRWEVEGNIPFDRCEPRRRPA